MNELIILVDYVQKYAKFRLTLAYVLLGLFGVVVLVFLILLLVGYVKDRAWRKKLKKEEKERNKKGEN